MRILSPSFVEKWKGRLVNIHPSYLPEFPGAHALRDALRAGVTRTGCTVHFVDEGVDSGPIIAQKRVKILPNDNEQSLQRRVKEVGGIPVDSEYVVFIIDTSGSMKALWGKVTK